MAATRKARSNAELLALVRDETANEKAVGRAIRLLASRGIDPRTGARVGVKPARKIAREMGDLAPG